MSTSLSNDVFGYKRNPKPRGVFSSENSQLVFGSASGGSMGYLVQNWQVSYTQQVQELFEIGSNNLYWAKGRPAGSGALGRIMGDVGAAGKSFFPASAYDICDGGATMELKAQGGHCDTAPAGGGGVILNTGVDITMSGCVVTSLGYSMQIGDVRLIESFAWRFGYMQLN